jgi:hypothetical protein
MERGNPDVNLPGGLLALLRQPSPCYLATLMPDGLAGRARRLRAGQGTLAAVGFCFGGLAALTLARSGAGLAAAVSIHGSLVTTRPAELDAVKARVLVCPAYLSAGGAHGSIRSIPVSR